MPLGVVDLEGLQSADVKRLGDKAPPTFSLEEVIEKAPLGQDTTLTGR
jgi:hypothetical protein